MQNPILLGRDSWMRFEQRSYTTLPRQHLLPHHPPQPIRGKLSLYHHDPNGASAFIPDNRSADDIYHLRFTGEPQLSRFRPTLFEVNLVRQSGTPAFTGNCMFNMLPREDPLSDTVIPVPCSVCWYCSHYQLATPGFHIVHSLHRP